VGFFRVCGVIINPLGGDSPLVTDSRNSSIEIEKNGSYGPKKELEDSCFWQGKQRDFFFLLQDPDHIHDHKADINQNKSEGSDFLEVIPKQLDGRIPFNFLIDIKKIAHQMNHHGIKQNDPELLRDGHIDPGVQSPINHNTI
jgi:hypothetical protein